MSVLHARIIQHGAQGHAMGGTHPYATTATPMVMPHSEISYDGTAGYYQDLYPSPVATGDVNAVPYLTVVGHTAPPTIPAGRP